MIDAPSSSDTTRHNTSELDSALAASFVDFDAIWRYQDEVRTCVNATLGDCIWNLDYNPIRQCIELELKRHLDDEELAMLTSQLTIPADYDGEGASGSMFVIYPW
jgi:hypothetical protein